MTKTKPLSYHANKFSEKVRTMNDANGKSLTLTAEEARNLHTDMFSMLSRIAELTVKPPDTTETSVVQDGGKFK